MNDRENKEKFERENEPLALCPNCNAIYIRGEWIEPSFDLANVYKGYREIYGDYTREKYCRRHDLNIEHKDTKPELERRKQRK